MVNVFEENPEITRRGGRSIVERQSKTSKSGLSSDQKWMSVVRGKGGDFRLVYGRHR